MRNWRLLIPLMGLAPIACDSPPAAGSSSPAPTGQVVKAAQPQVVLLTAADKVGVHGLHYPAANPKALILLFHQAGSNKAEYATIAPRLAAAGYSVLAIDQRSGSTLFGATNETVDTLGRESDYGDAIKDLRAALGWAADRKLAVILWGSSYSSSLVLQLASENPGKIAALLAFSPDEYFGGGNPVRRWASGVKAPLFVTSATDGEEIAAAKALVAASPSANKRQFVPESGGVHGSSTLIAARNATGAEENWRAVMAFLAEVAP